MERTGSVMVSVSEPRRSMAGRRTLMPCGAGSVAAFALTSFGGASLPQAREPAHSGTYGVLID
jgi:hypothetical protein